MQGRQVNAFHVDRVAFVKISLSHVERALVAVRPACVVDHHVQPAVVLQGSGYQRFHICRLGNVGCKKRRGTTSLHNGGHHLIAQRSINVVNNYFGALRSQPLGNALANAAASAGDDDGFVVYAQGIRESG